MSYYQCDVHVGYNINHKPVRINKSHLDAHAETSKGQAVVHISICGTLKGSRCFYSVGRSSVFAGYAVSQCVHSSPAGLVPNVVRTTPDISVQSANHMATIIAPSIQLLTAILEGALNRVG